MKENKWFTITLVLAGIFTLAAIVFLVLTSNPGLLKGDPKQSLLFSSTLLTSGLALFFGGIHLFIHERDKESAATMISIGVLTALGGGFFLIFGLEQ